MSKLFDYSIVNTHILSLLEWLQQSANVTIRRSFHSEKQTLRISQGTVEKGVYALRRLCYHKARSISLCKLSM